MSSQSEVEAELARLKGGSAPAAIEGAEDGGEILKADQTQSSESKDSP
jgi:phage shock protein A